MSMRITVGDVEFDDVTMQEAADRMVEMASRRDKPRFVCTGNLDHLELLSRDAEFVDAYRAADLVLADGAPVVWLSRLGSSGKRLRERVAGSDLFWELARRSEESGVRLFFLGGAPGAAERASDAVRKRYPLTMICGSYCPPYETFATEEEQSRIREIVHEANPDILLVAFGAPKQEKWICKNKDLLGVPVSIGVGGTLEMAAGIVRRAPVWMRRSGLEWSFRFLQEPSRLFQRYFVRDLPFLISTIYRSLTGRA